jgi:hypothetical protein
VSITVDNDEQSPTNMLKGRNSKDMWVGDLLVPHINRSVSPYPTEVTAPRFELVPVKEQKDLMLNTARLYAQQEYDRIMALVSVLQQQALQIKRRLEITDWVHSAQFNFKLYPGRTYWLVLDTRAETTILTPTGPRYWSTGVPLHWNYLAQVKYMGDSTWMEVTDDGVPL